MTDGADRQEDEVDEAAEELATHFRNRQALEALLDDVHGCFVRHAAPWAPPSAYEAWKSVLRALRDPSQGLVKCVGAPADPGGWFTRLADEAQNQVAACRFDRVRRLGTQRCGGRADLHLAQPPEIVLAQIPRDAAPEELRDALMRYAILADLTQAQLEALLEGPVASRMMRLLRVVTASATPEDAFAPPTAALRNYEKIYRRHRMKRLAPWVLMGMLVAPAAYWLRPVVRPVAVTEVKALYVAGPTLPVSRAPRPLERPSAWLTQGEYAEVDDEPHRGKVQANGRRLVLRGEVAICNHAPKAGSDGAAQCSPPGVDVPGTAGVIATVFFRTSGSPHGQEQSFTCAHDWPEALIPANERHAHVHLPKDRPPRDCFASLDATDGETITARVDHIACYLVPPGEDASSEQVRKKHARPCRTNMENKDKTLTFFVEPTDGD